MEDMEVILDPILCNRDPSLPVIQVLLFSATMPPEIEGALRKYTRAASLVRVDTIGKAINKTSETVTHCSLKCPWYELKELIPDIVYGAPSL
jgi:superfamily II DNA/RNA helicase